MLTAVSLFSSAGIGDLALRRAGFDIIVSNELLDDRHALFSSNFPDTESITGDINESKDEVIAATLTALEGHELDLLYATPPCQGMSKNGRGKLLQAIRAGRKPANDKRNQLIIPTLDLASALRPRAVLLENVPEMARTEIVNEEGHCELIVDYIRRRLGEEYVLATKTVEFADYGVPQCRQRLITIAIRDPTACEWLNDGHSPFPRATHARKSSKGLKPWVSVDKALKGLPELDAGCSRTASSSIALHRVPLLDEMKYWWVANTPAGQSAFDNQCTECECADNPRHSARRGSDGVNRASRSTPVHCIECGALLPRPSVEREGKRELMRGFTSAYKRMDGGKPASALTRNLSYACSDNKIHPKENRVLSLHEALILHTVDQYDYEWRRADEKRVSDKTIREVIGESIPPLGLQPFAEGVQQLLEKGAIEEGVPPRDLLFSIE